ncbi:hypothetical protein ACFVVM_32765 [Nocardia sp. NPDC058176]|uniref:hypothetical protein n=1 Tax=Nocardia sp. NPDC058176 TaxID=3346368 RepID=UPI0036DE2EAE
MRVLSRQLDSVPGRASVRCELLSGPVLGSWTTGVAVAEVQWDDLAQIQAWLADHPAPQPRRGSRKRTTPATPSPPGVQRLTSAYCRETVLIGPGMTIAGFALLHGELLDAEIRAGLSALGEPASGLYGALFVYDVEDCTTRRWTLFTADGPYAEMLTRAGGVEADVRMLQEKFPAFVPGWVLHDEHEVTPD